MAGAYIFIGWEYNIYQCEERRSEERNATHLVVVDDGGLLAHARGQLLLGQPCGGMDDDDGV